MKTFITILFAVACLTSMAQVKSKNKKVKNPVRTSRSVRPHMDTIPLVPRQTITEKRLNGNPPFSATKIAAQDSSPFVSGIHAADNAAKKYDSVALVNPNNILNNSQPTVATGVGNDTISNPNTIVQNGIATTSGAVDKSGQAQFGQTNWGSSRSTIGEGQWTVPPPVSSAFSKDLPTIKNVTWNRSNTDTAIYWARYQSGSDWIISSYNSTGNTLDRRTEISIQQLPSQLSGFIRSQPSPFQASSVYRLQIPGRQDLYEIRTPQNRIMYVNMNGEEVKY